MCITQSLGSPFGCGVVVPEYGVCLNNFLNWGEVTQSRNALIPGGPLLILVDLLWPLWDARRQTLHDKIAGTVVLRRVSPH